MLPGVLYLFLASFIAPCVLASDSLVVHLSSGTFRGQTTADDINTWLGIPYAQPPVGPLRFRAPVPITRPIPGIHNATSFGDSCPQPALGGSQSEDCLSLNVRIRAKLDDKGVLHVTISGLSPS